VRIRSWGAFGRFKIRRSTVHEATPFLLNTNMTHPDQWGAQARDAPRPDVPYAKQPSPGVAPIQQDQRYIDPGAPFDSGRFKPKTRINDPIFLIVFVAQFAGFCVVSALALSTWISQGGLGGGLGDDNTGTSITLNRHTVYLLLFVVATGLLLSTAYLVLTRTFTTFIVHISLILSILLNVLRGICIYYYIVRYWSGAIIFTVIALLSILSYVGFRSRIPLASLLLQIVMYIAKHHKSVYVVALTTLLLQASLSV